MANIQERVTQDGKKVYRVQVRLKGFPAETATFPRLTDARKWAQSTEAAMREGRYFKTSEAKRHTLGDAIDRYLETVLPQKSKSSQYSQTIQLGWWKRKLGDYALADVTPAVIAEARDDLAGGITRFKQPRSNSTVRRYLAALSHVLTVAVREWGWLPSNPMQAVQKPKEPRGRVRFLSDEERRSLLQACRESRNKALYDVVVLALSTGMRRNEIMNLTWDAVDLDRGTITIEDTKNGERRMAPLAGHALARMRERSRLRRLDTRLVFPAPMAPHKAPKPIDIESAWQHALKRAGLAKDEKEDESPKDVFRFHDLRHSAASYMLMNGATLGELAEILGHKTLQMVKRYSHISESHASALVARMNAAIFEGEEKRA